MGERESIGWRYIFDSPKSIDISFISECKHLLLGVFDIFRRRVAEGSDEFWCQIVQFVPSNHQAVVSA